MLAGVYPSRRPADLWRTALQGAMRARSNRTPRDKRPVHNPHDKFFRALLEDPERAKDFLLSHLPADIRKLLSDALPVLEDGILLDETLRHECTDLLFRVELTTGEAAFLFILLEHKSRSEPQALLQLAGYMVQIWKRYAQGSAERLRSLPPIIPIILHHGASRWSEPLTLLDMIDACEDLRPWMPDFSILLIDLGCIPEDQLAQGRELRAGLIAMRLASLGNASREELAAVLQPLQPGSRLEAQTLAYIVDAFHIDVAVLQAAVRTARPDHWEMLMETIAETWIKQGKAEGKASTLIRLLGRRFGPLPDSTRVQIDAASEKELNDWIDAILDAPTLAAVFRNGSSP